MKRTHIMIHCLDTPRGVPFDKEDVIRWHCSPRSKGGRGWKNPGYAGIWLLDGTLEILKPFDADLEVDPWEITNGAAGWNGVATHFGYVGGAANQDTRTPQQLAAMQNTIELLLMLWPGVQLIGHNQVNPAKYCPSFDVPTWAAAMGWPEQNIDRNTYHNISA